MSQDCNWYYVNGQTRIGPLSKNDLVHQIKNGSTLIFGPGCKDKWVEASQNAEIAEALNAKANIPPPPPLKADEVEFEIFGDDTQYIEVALDPGEMMVAEAGALMFMENGIQMETVIGNPDARIQEDGVQKAMNAASRLISGESLFFTTFTNRSEAKAKVAFAAPYTGKIQIINLDELGGELICQKGSFLCAPRGIQLTVALQSNLAVGLFGGEGFVMQSLKGHGYAVIHAGGMFMRRTLKPGETLRIDTGCVVAYTPTVNFDVEFLKEIKSALFGGEGYSMASLTGPGEVWLQSLPFSRFAARVFSAAVNPYGREEGSLIGALSGTGTGGTMGAIGTLAGSLGALGKFGRLLS